ncbi:MAG: LacI family DNA-binding transcriptional regulator [Planctomycetota bacterium]
MVTLNDIAKAARVSTNTVSRALQADVAYRRPTFQKRAEHIRHLAEQMGYRPNASARAIRQGSFNALTLLMSTDPSRSELPKGMFYGIQAAASGHGLAVHLNIVDDAQLESESFVPDALRQWHSDGLLVNYHKDPPERLYELIQKYEVPAVWLNLDADSDCVRPDDFAVGQAAARQMIDLGHRRVWYVGYSYKRDDFHYSEIDRRDGYIAAMRDAGLQPRAVDIYDRELGGLEWRLERWREVFDTPDAPTAVIAYGAIGLTVVLDAAARRGVRVPDDLSISTFSGSPIFHAGPVSTWLVPDYEVGRRGVEMLIRKITHPNEANHSTKIEFSISEEGSSVDRPSRPDS